MMVMTTHLATVLSVDSGALECFWYDMMVMTTHLATVLSVDSGEIKDNRPNVHLHGGHMLESII
jgi:hypothetical protein